MLLSIADSRPRNLESARTQSLLPSNIQGSAANLIAFIEKYYEYINSVGLPSSEIGGIITDKDIDTPSNLYLDNIRELIALNIPNSTVLDKVSLYKIIVKYYNTRGSEESIAAFFKIFLNVIVSVSYPKDQLFTPSSGKFKRMTYAVEPMQLTSAPVNGIPDKINVSAIEQVLTFGTEVFTAGTPVNQILTIAVPLTSNGSAVVTFGTLSFVGFYNGKMAYTNGGAISATTTYTDAMYYDSARWVLEKTGAGVSIAKWWNTTAADLTQAPTASSIWTAQGSATGTPVISFVTGDASPPATVPINGNMYAAVGTGHRRVVYICTDAGTAIGRSIVWEPFQEWQYENVRGMPSNTDKIQDSYYWQLHSYTINSPIDSSVWLDQYLRFVHPAGLKLFAQLFLQVFSANEWNNPIENYYFLQTASDPNSWLSSLIWDKTQNHQHSPKYQPGWNRDKQLSFTTLVNSNLDNNSTTAKVFAHAGYVALNIRLIENANGSPQSERMMNAAVYDSALKFLDPASLDTAVLNSTIAQFTEPYYSTSQYGIMRNLSAYVEQTQTP